MSKVVYFTNDKVAIVFERIKKTYCTTEYVLVHFPNELIALQCTLFSLLS